MDDDDVVERARDPSGRFSCYNRLLGSGAYKSVYQGYDHDNGVDIAWNEIRVDRMSKETLDTLDREVELLRNLKCEFIIKFISSFHHGKMLVFITELMSSGTLREFLDRRNRSGSAPKLRVIKRWARQILKGVAYLHNQQPPIIHRDLKCDNIFMNSSEGKVKIGDMGLSCTMVQDHAVSVLGTPEFMAPELYDEFYNEKVDVYAFGMSVMEMVTGEKPYSECTNPAQVFKKVTSGTKPAVLGRIMDDEVVEFIELCLAPASERLSCVELLVHPFLQEQSPMHERLKETQPVRMAPREGHTRQGSARMSNGMTPQTVAVAAAAITAANQAIGGGRFAAPQTPAGLPQGPLVDEEEEKSPRDGDDPSAVRVEGHGEQQEDGVVTVKLLLEFDDKSKEIEFDFHTAEDTTSDVVKELASELDLPEGGYEQIGQDLDRIIEQAVSHSVSSPTRLTDTLKAAPGGEMTSSFGSPVVTGEAVGVVGDESNSGRVGIQYEIAGDALTEFDTGMHRAGRDTSMNELPNVMNHPSMAEQKTPSPGPPPKTPSPTPDMSLNTSLSTIQLPTVKTVAANSANEGSGGGGTPPVHSIAGILSDGSTSGTWRRPSEAASPQLCPPAQQMQGTTPPSSPPGSPRLRSSSAIDAGLSDPSPSPSPIPSPTPSPIPIPMQSPAINHAKLTKTKLDAHAAMERERLDERRGRPSGFQPLSASSQSEYRRDTVDSTSQRSQSPVGLPPTPSGRPANTTLADTDIFNVLTQGPNAGSGAPSPARSTNSAAPSTSNRIAKMPSSDDLTSMARHSNSASSLTTPGHKSRKSTTSVRPVGDINERMLGYADLLVTDDDRPSQAIRPELSSSGRVSQQQLQSMQQQDQSGQQQQQQGQSGQQQQQQQQQQGGAPKNPSKGAAVRPEALDLSEFDSLDLNANAPLSARSTSASSLIGAPNASMTKIEDLKRTAGNLFEQEKKTRTSAQSTPVTGRLSTTSALDISWANVATGSNTGTSSVNGSVNGGGSANGSPAIVSVSSPQTSTGGVTASDRVLPRTPNKSIAHLSDTNVHGTPPGEPPKDKK